MPLVLDGDTGIVGVLLTDANGNVTFDTNTLYVDAPNNRVGIGTTTPNTTFTVSTGAATNSARFTDNTNSELYIKHSSGNLLTLATGSTSQPLIFSQGSTERMRISNSGDIVLGDGTVSPNEKLTVVGNIEVYNNDADGYIWFHDFGDASWSIGMDNSDQRMFKIVPGTGLTSAGSVNIKNNAVVGIGTALIPDAASLTLAQDLKLVTPASSKSRIFSRTDGTGAYTLGTSGGAAVVLERLADNSDEIAFETHYAGFSHAERMRITKEGYVGIGTSSPETKLDVNGAALIKDKVQITPNGVNYNSSASRFASGAALEVITDNVNSSGLVITNSTGYAHTWFNYSDGNNYITSDTTNNTGDTILRSFSGGPSAPTYTERMRVQGSNGYVGIGTDSPQTPLHIQTNTAGIATEIRLKNLQGNRESRLSFWDENNINQLQLQYDNGSNRAYLNTNGNGLTVYSNQASGEIARFGLPGGGNSYISSYFTGDVLIGGTTPSSSYGLEIQKSDAGAGLYLHRKDTASMVGAGIYHAYQLTQTNGQSARLAEITALGVSNWGGSLTFATKPANGAPNNSATVRMTIDQDGAVFTPYQPGFHVSNNVAPGTSSFSGDSTLLHFDVVVHTDGNWSTANKRYTIPKAGKYLIYAQVRFDGSTGYSRCYVSVNGASGWWSPGLHTIYDNTSTSYRSHTVSGVLNLSANDYIELRGGTNNSSGTHQGEGSFGAHFLG